MWNEGRTFLLVTGASRGIGRAVSKALSEKLIKGSVVYLTGRSLDGLQDTSALISREGLTVRTFVIDHGRADILYYRNILMADLNGSDFESLVLVHNAGSVGTMNLASFYQDPLEIAGLWTLNYTSPVVLNSVVLQHFGECQGVKTIINVSSLCGIKPMPTLGHYCSIKAARDMLFKVLALEEKTAGSKVRVLNYAPGPIDTQMVRGIVADPGADPDVKGGFVKLITEETILQPDQTAAKLVEILDKDAFESGQHVDYYD